jgi:ADP-heptose:LPS heptosyltransferase
MSNILIIKHGSLGDIIQANGAIKDIKNFHKNRKVFLLTTEPYAIFMSECPYLDGVIIDKRLPRWNLFYLKNLKRNLAKYNIAQGFEILSVGSPSVEQHQSAIHGA